MNHECGNGWESLILQAEAIVHQYNIEHPDIDFPLKFTQIKEKWGGLRLYLNQYIPEVSDKIHELENKSFHLCEICGTSESVKTEWTHGWVMTLCDKCRKEEINNFNKRYDY